MNPNIISEITIKRPPISVVAFNDKLYVATKGYKVYCFENVEEKPKFITFKYHVNFLTASNNIIYCACDNGKIIGLDKFHKTVFKTHPENSSVTYCKYDKITNKLIVGNKNSKLYSFSENGITQHSLLCTTMPITSFDTNSKAVLCSATQNNKTLHFFDLLKTVKSTLKIEKGFPETVLFVSENLILVGTVEGFIHLYAKIKNNYKLCDTYVGSGSVETIFLLDNQRFLVGFSKCKIAEYKIENNNMNLVYMMETKGIPIQFCKYKHDIAVAISREPKMGRWNRKKKGFNQILMINRNQSSK